MENALRFPEGFLWGSATSAYQVEGGIENCDWSKFFPAGRACDHYSLYEKDFGLLQSLGQNAYRFSIEWSRVEPKEGEWNEAEINHYRLFLESLRAKNIKTFVTLHHYTNPVWMAEMGGWANPKVIFYFSRFAEKMLRECGDLVDFWATINEPLIYASEGYLIGLRPPKKRNYAAFLGVVKNQVSAHKKIYRIFHESKKDAKVGIVHNLVHFEPYFNRSPLDQLVAFLAKYFWNELLLSLIKNNSDFIGLNYYFHNKIMFPGILKNENKIVTDVGWEIYPEGIYKILKDLRKYKKPIYVTENGLADAQDKLRKDFIKEHLCQIWRAVKEGVDVRGYFHWSLMDNFEWEKGFVPRFGMIEIDYETLERKIRPSAYYYADICKNNRLIY